ncbi:CASP-like protein 1 [Coffea arabica]|uniref:CASP-like protein n=1 Tax=Coffea arabica TaxID=13443 RepID=A0A6P6X5H4_COFAR|nr:CASP-like protein 1 [Coffea arabica]
MASSEKAAPGPEKIEAAVTATEPEKIEPPPPAKPTLVPEEPPPETKAVATESPPINYFPTIDVVLRVLLFAAAVVSVVVTVTSKQTELVAIPFPPFRAPVPAKFNHSPALIYLVAALSVAGLYGIISTLLSVYALLKPDWSTRLLSHLVIFDVLLLGIVASATGAAGGVAYVGLKGNSHVGWRKVCDTYDVFCKHLASSIAISLFASVLLVLLVLLSIYSLSKKIPK